MRISYIQNTNFEAMKPNQFKGFDYSCVRKFKAPVEKFNTENNFYTWAQNKVNKLIDKKIIAGKSNYTVAQRRDLIYEWVEGVGRDLLNSSILLIILSSILKELKETNDKLPEIFIPEVVNNSINEIKNKLEKDKDFKFNFKDIYCKNLKNEYLKDDNYTGWIKIPYLENDSKNFQNNVNKLKILSNNTWCTKSITAKVLLKLGDFHIWLKDGNPKIALRFKDDLITEIRNELNQNSLTQEDFDVVQSYILEKGFAMEGTAINTYQKAKKIATTLQKLNKAIGENSANKEFEIFKYFGFHPTKCTDNSISISEYRKPTEEFTFAELGFDETELFKNVSEIRGNAIFKDSSLKELKNLKRILGNAEFDDSQINHLGELTSIEGNASFTNTQIFSTEKIEFIGGNADFRDCHIRRLENIERIGGNLLLNSYISSLGKLKYIGGSANLDIFSNLEYLEEIGGDAYLGIGIKGLGNLHTIKGNAYFMYSQLDTLENLKYIGGYFFPGINMTPDKYSHIKIGKICDKYREGDE